jgi:hypothetical protein
MCITPPGLEAPVLRIPEMLFLRLLRIHLPETLQHLPPPGMQLADLLRVRLLLVRTHGLTPSRSAPSASPATRHRSGAESDPGASASERPPADARRTASAAAISSGSPGSSARIDPRPAMRWRGWINRAAAWRERWPSTRSRRNLASAVRVVGSRCRFLNRNAPSTAGQQLAVNNPPELRCEPRMPVDNRDRRGSVSAGHLWLYTALSADAADSACRCVYR